MIFFIPAATQVRQGDHGRPLAHSACRSILAILVRLTVSVFKRGNDECFVLEDNISFSPLTIVSTFLQLRKFVKATTVDRFRKQVKQLIDAAERNSEFVGRRRDAVTFSPKDAAAVKDFLQVMMAPGALLLEKRHTYDFASSEVWCSEAVTFSPKDTAAVKSLVHIRLTEDLGKAYECAIYRGFLVN